MITGRNNTVWLPFRLILLLLVTTARLPARHRRNHRIEYGTQCLSGIDMIHLRRVRRQPGNVLRDIARAINVFVKLNVMRRRLRRLVTTGTLRTANRRTVFRPLTVPLVERQHFNVYRHFFLPLLHCRRKFLYLLSWRVLRQLWDRFALPARIVL